MNLTCGRNPWKRAAMDDSTFKAFMKDPNFLKSILPLSDELNYVLQRIFEVNPQRRISLPELRELIVRCPRLTQGNSTHDSPLTPPYTPLDSPVETPFVQYHAPAEVPSMDPLPGLQYPPMACPPHGIQPFSLPAPLISPPQSTTCSPQPSSYTYAVRPSVSPMCSPYASNNGYMPSVPVWPRCGQLIANFHIPRSACLWNNVPIY